MPLVDIINTICEGKASRSGTRLFANSHWNMDTPASDIKLCATNAVDITGNAAFAHGRVTTTDRLPDQYRRKPVARRQLLAISLDIVTERASVVLITVHASQLPVTESLHSRHKKGGWHGRHPETRST
jgi:hypothetical protein